ncbi:MAG: DNA repair protein RecN [Flavobacteriales bacterium]|nr:DNA repair protein RecN [Flavobacteriaceae bacterium]MDO7581807.1 DNA repair protein RecN [Flavobacteriaceae bacterium]MDO7591383.1 DNA repair protein RecN [Flavobacteriaceae bacterium]MDO7602880.1 DNA repair protein RecN [Flavobacteriaceae bacterium]
MLTGLIIKNFALIDHLEVNFSSGMTSITGETGAGKSILLGGLGLVLGNRADLSTLKDLNQKCFVEATFSIQDYKLKDLFEELDLDYDSITLIRREILPTGKSRAFVNDTPVNLNTLQRLGQELIDVHSQHQTLSLTQTEYQLEVLDALASNKELLIEYQNKLVVFKSLDDKLNKLTALQDSQKQDLEYSTFLLEELIEANLVSGMLIPLEEEEQELIHAEEIGLSLLKASQIISEEQMGVEEQLNEIRSALQKVSLLSEKYAPLFNRVESLKIELLDLNQEIQLQAEQIEANPQRLEVVKISLQKIYDLQAKHKCQSVEELIAICESLDEKVQSTATIGEDLIKLAKEREVLNDELLELAQNISHKRKNTIPSLKEELESLLGVLGMPNARFNIDLLPSQRMLLNGKDELVFEFSANKGSNFGSLKKVASGGELSRIMLSIKAILSRFKTLPTIIFDEIDTGVSGEVSYKIGEVMHRMSRYMQVITISHLPQVAAKGAHHFKVYKETIDQSTYTQLKKLNPEDRIQEIAQMLGGEEISETAVQHAKELLN